MALDKLIKDIIKHFKLDLTVISLIFVNIVTLIFAILKKWDIKTIFYIYFYQTIIIWFFTIFKLIFKNNKKHIFKKDNKDKLNNNLKIEKIKTFLSLIFGLPALFILVFFILKTKLTQGIVFLFVFCYLLYFIFYLSENKKEDLLGLIICYPVIFASIFFIFKLSFGNPVFNLEIKFVIFLFFINHLLSFIYYLKNKYVGAQFNQTIIKIMALRIIIIYIIICLLWLFKICITKANSVLNLIAIVLLFIIKTPIDIYYHNKGFYRTKKNNHPHKIKKKAKANESSRNS